MHRLKELAVMLGVGLFVFIAMLAGVSYLSRVFQPKNSQAEFGMIEPAANGFLGERDSSIDVLFVGDSEVYASLSPMQMWGVYGFTSYDAASAGQTLAYGDTLLERALARQRPRVVVFETNFLYKEYSMSDELFRLQERIARVRVSRKVEEPYLCGLHGSPREDMERRAQGVSGQSRRGGCRL